MLNIVFKNLEPSQMARDIVQEKLDPILVKFPMLKAHKIAVTLEMENSPSKAGPDIFNVTAMISGRSLKKLRLRKSSGNLYQSVSLLADVLSEQLGQEKDKLKQKKRSSLRVLNTQGVFYDE